MHETFLRDFYNNTKLSFTVIMTPFPPTTLDKEKFNALTGILTFNLIGVAYMIVSLSLFISLSLERIRDIKH